ncbi:MAG: hypothetical protein ACOH16_06620 [Propionibacteriaceae bacterium]
MNRLTWIAPIVFVVVMLGGVGIAQASGAWITTGKQVVVAGALSVDDVKGSMSLQVASDGVGVTVDDLIALINPSDRSLLSPATLFKEIEAFVPGFELSAFRETLRAFLAARDGTPSPTPLPSASPTTAPSPATASPSATHTSTPTGTGTGKRTR